MLRINDNFIKKVYRTDLTKQELLLLIELIKIINDEGIATIYYKTIINDIGCSTATFYNCLASLEEKNLIEKFKENTKEIKVGISNVSSADCSYVKINNIFFCKSIYKKLSAGAIRVMLYLCFRTAHNINKEENKNFYKEYYDTIADQLQISIRMVKLYIKELYNNNILDVGIKKVFKFKKFFDVLTIKKSILKTEEIEVHEKSAKSKININQGFYTHLNCIKNYIRRAGITIKDKLCLNDITLLITQYKALAKDKGCDIYKTVEIAIKTVVDAGMEVTGVTVHKMLLNILKRNSIYVRY